MGVMSAEFLNFALMECKMLHIEETDSTNRYVREMAGQDDVCVWTDYQTAGRGCGTNSWESERGKNLLFSVRCHPQNVDAARQYLLLEAMSLAVKGVMEECIPAGTLTIKWPNDIYWNDRKLAGTLTECGLSGGRVKWCIIGTGINVNQEHFLSDAPNPVSVVQAGGGRQAAEPLLGKVLSRFGEYLRRLEEGDHEAVHGEYLAALYRREGLHLFRDATGLFRARMVTVRPDGTLVLEDDARQQRTYRFKEVQFDNAQRLHTC